MTVTHHEQNDDPVYKFLKERLNKLKEDIIKEDNEYSDDPHQYLFRSLQKLVEHKAIRVKLSDDNYENLQYVLAQNLTRDARLDLIAYHCPWIGVRLSWYIRCLKNRLHPSS